MTEIVGEKLAHTAYRRRGGNRADEVDRGFIWRVMKVQKMTAVPFPLGGMTGVALRDEKKLFS